MEKNTQNANKNTWKRQRNILKNIKSVKRVYQLHLKRWETSNMTTQLKDIILAEGTTNRVSLQRIDAILANFAEKLEKKEQEKLASAYVEVKELADTLNMTPYTIFNHEHWKLLNIILMGKVAELKLVVEDIAKDNKEIDCWPLMKAIDLILTY